MSTLSLLNQNRDTLVRMTNSCAALLLALLVASAAGASPAPAPSGFCRLPSRSRAADAAGFALAAVAAVWWSQRQAPPRRR